MPSVSGFQARQCGQWSAPARGLPQAAHIGNANRGREASQQAQKKDPSLPQPTHLGGKRKSMSLPLTSSSRAVNTRLLLILINV